MECTNTKCGYKNENNNYYCVECGHRLRHKVVKCFGCRQPLTTKFCSKCGCGNMCQCEFGKCSTCKKYVDNSSGLEYSCGPSEICECTLGDTKCLDCNRYLLVTRPEG